MLLAHGASIDLPGPDGFTAREILRRKRDPDFQLMAARPRPDGCPLSAAPE
jgi:hypothetical protein